MDKILIYEDNEIQVEMYKEIAEWLEYLGNNEYNLNNIEQEEVLDNMINSLGIDIDKLKNIPILTTRKVPIIHRDTFAPNLLPPFDIFMDSILLLIESFCNRKGEVDSTWIREISILIKLYSSHINNDSCHITFFTMSHSHITGFFSYIDDEKIILLPFIINDKDNYYRLCQ